ncbi:MAG: SPASM domain-containing protein [candidate division NC10 bacterium]|nr:SPASM domain-containing protein [candidate division NC10 bacterium]
MNAVKATTFALKLALRRPKGWLSLILNQMAAMARWEYVPCLPVHVTVEPTNACDMGCPVCETGAGILERRTGRMTLEHFQKIVDQIAPHANTLFFYFMGEPFLYKDAYAMIRYAKEKGISVDTCTNGHFVDAERLVWSRLDEISFQIGGITQRTHEIYRVKGNLERSLENLQAVLAERERQGTRHPRVKLGFIVMKHNEHEVEEFKRLAEKLKVDQAVVIDPCVRDMDQAKQFLPRDERYWFYDQEAFERGMLRPKLIPNNECWWIWHSTLITWNGDVVPCCRDPHGRHAMGNVLKEPLKAIWNNERYRAFRRRILTNQRGIDICSLCSSYGLPELKTFES